MHKRLRKQAQSIRIFDEISLNTETNLDQEFTRDFAHLLSPKIRGYGYYVWKPQIIIQALRKARLGDIIVYLDSGSHINPAGRPRMLEYLEICRESARGILAFQLSLPERHWTKKKLFEYFEVLQDQAILQTGQVQSGLIVIEKRPKSEEFFRAWLDPYRTDVALVDDSRSDNETVGFQEHRHDQSVFSVLAKLRGVELLNAQEQFPGSQTPNSRIGSWSSLRNFPIHHKRDKRTGPLRMGVMLLRFLFPSGSIMRELLVRLRSH